MPRKVNGTSGHSVEKHGEGIGGGPVGSAGGYSGRPGGTSQSENGRASYGSKGSSSLGSVAVAGLLALLLGNSKKGGSGSSGNGGNKNGGGLNLSKIIRIAIVVIIAIWVLKSCSGNVSYTNTNTASQSNTFATQTPIQTPVPAVKTPAPATQAPVTQAAQSTGYGIDLSSLLGGVTTVNSGITSSGWAQSEPAATVDTTVTSGARAKFYTPKQGDKVTIMVYMCGTDLESGSGMATSDLQEMAASTISDDVNLIVYAGGCSGWKNNLMSTKTNQIYQILSGGKFKCLNDNAGNVSMTDPDTLAGFIQFCEKYFPAERNALIFWDHGGGSLTGYGYDQKFKSSGSMTLDGIDEALKAGGVKFDFIGFDACLMATAETALMCSDYADYLVASEESEPGIGWYYTNWLTKLSKNTSITTVELGKQIVDDFVDVCAQKCRGQDTTLSVVDLAELAYTLPSKLNDFSTATTAMLQNNQYRTVATARGSSKEFASSSKIDQVDLAHLAYNLNTDAGNALANTIRSAVKYNRTSSTVQNAYGLSIYFPYRSVSSVKSAVSTYSSIGMDSEYSRCIQAYATYASSGQASSGGYSSAFGSLLGSGYGSYGSSSSYGSSYSSGYGSSAGYSNSGYSYGSGSSYGSSYSSYEDIYSLLAQMMGGRSLGNVKGLTNDNSGFIGDTFSNGTLDAENVAQFITENKFNDSALVWTRDENGELQISLSDDQWALVQELMLNLFIDDGEGYIDLGLDLSADYFTSEGALKGDFDGVWLTVNDWNCAFYLESIVDGVATGRIPVLYNGQRANLILEIEDDCDPVIVGVRYDYHDSEIGTVAKSIAYGAGNVELSISGDEAIMPAGSDDISLLQSGDEIILVADYYDYDNNYQDSYMISNPLTVGSGLDIGYKYLANPEIANACFRFTDIYGQTYWTPMMENA